jgi:hypothetical protein
MQQHHAIPPSHHCHIGTNPTPTSHKTPSLCRIADAVHGRLLSLQAGAFPTAPPAPSSSARPSLDGPASSSTAASPGAAGWAVADPLPLLERGPLGRGAARAHVLGGLYLASSLMTKGGAGAGRAPTPPGQQAPRQFGVSASWPSGSSGGGGGGNTQAAGLALPGLRPPPLSATPPSPTTPSSNPLRRTSTTGLQYDYPEAAPASPAWQLQPSFLAAPASARADGSAVGPASPVAAAAAGAAAAAAAAAAPLPALLFSAGRGQLAAWLRCCGDVMCGLALVEPDTFLNEISHGLAGEAYDLAVA